MTVTTTADSGPGSLRDAIARANSVPAIDLIAFNIPGPGVHTIRPLSALPEVMRATTINGTSQPGYAGRPLIELDGSAAGPLTDGLVLKAQLDTVRALVINRFGRHGIVIAAGARGFVESSYVGTDASGTRAAGNGGAGIVVQSTAGVGRLVTGQPSAGNVISGNVGPGLWVNIPVGTPNGFAEIMGNFIGIDAGGSRALGNGREGVLVDSGQAKIGINNVISGNGWSGVRLNGPAAKFSRVEHNYIGTSAAGTSAIPNGTSASAPFHDGVTSQFLDNAQFNGNLISGNIGNGVWVRGGSAASFVGNKVGTDFTGNGDLGNGGHGVAVTDVASALVDRNTLSGNAGDGLYVEANIPLALSMSSDFVGTNSTHNGRVGNDGAGIEIVGSVSGMVGGDSVIAANGGSGVVLTGFFNSSASTTRVPTVRLTGNFIGTDISGSADFGNGGDGVTADEFLGAIVGNVISGNGRDGIRASNSRVAGGITGNFIGTNAAGTGALGNGDNGIELQSSATTVGGLSAADRNVISGNRGHGILLASPPVVVNFPDDASILSNYIGTDVTGGLALGNGGSGVFVAAAGSHIIGNSGAGNVISGNRGDGVTIVGAPVIAGVGRPVVGRVRVRGNRIGTDAAGSDAFDGLGNGGAGVRIVNSTGNSVGAVTSVPTLGNTIAFNGGSGVEVEAGPGAPAAPGPADDNLITHNSIFSNGGLGIDLYSGYEGVTPNDASDADAGPNRLQNFPVITRAATGPTSGTVVSFTLDSEPSHFYTVDFYSSPAKDPSGYGEGKKYLGFGRVMTDAAGHASGVVTLPATAAGEFITATATPLDSTTGGIGGTSEFSAARQVVETAPGSAVRPAQAPPRRAGVWEVLAGAAGTPL
jgi:hypothetical protein